MMGLVVATGDSRDSRLLTEGADDDGVVSVAVDAAEFAPIVPGVGVELARLRLRDRLFGEATAPMRVGRYVVLRQLGAGGMGVVFSAHDPDLDRRVAVKVLRASGESTSLARARLVREAQSIARVSHPNVIAVYEVGEDAGHVYIAMELVEGTTLRVWLRDRARPWVDVVSVLLQAGRGLAAGHAANVIHRDFKPDNAMIGVDGRVRVLDFGLARSGDDHPSDVLGETHHDDIMCSALTPTGMAVGTPAYMAPEQFMGAEADATSDQFSFCVALFEGLYGQRPFAGKSPTAIREAVRSGQIFSPPKSAVPKSLHRIVLRGLQADPARRWPSMAALLEAIERTTGRRRVLGVTAIIAGGAMALGVGLLWNLDTASASSRCTAGPERTDAVWNDDRREAIATAFRGVGTAFADDALRSADASLVRHLDQWEAAYASACTEADRTTPAGQAQLDAVMACLDARLGEVGALVDVWAQADALAIERAPDAAMGLESVDRCAEVDATSAPAPEIAQAVAAVTEDLARAKASRAAGRYAPALEQARELLLRATEIGHVPTIIEARRLVGLLEHDTGDYAAAETTAERTYDEARGAREDRAAFEAALELVTILGDRRSRPDDALRWARHAEAVLDGSPPNPSNRGRLLAQVGLVRHLAGDHERALVDEREALALLEQAEIDTPILVAAHTNLGMLFRALERQDEALEHYRRAEALINENLPPESASLGHVLDGIASIHYDQEKFDLAEPEYRHALAIRERVLGPEHSFVASTCSGLGTTLVAMGKVDEGLPYHERAVRIVEARMGENHSLTLAAVVNLAGAYVAKEDFVRARELTLRGRAIAEATHGPNHPVTISVLKNLAFLEDALGNTDAVLALLEQVVEAKRATLGEAHPEVVAARQELAEARAAAGAPAADDPRSQ